MLIEDCLKLFNLKPGADLNDVKKAHRLLAKENHPDRFPNADSKKKHEAAMIKIDEAYEIIITHFREIKSRQGIKRTNSDKNEIENDYAVYRKGVDYYYQYCGDGIKKKNIFNVDYKSFEFDMELLDKKYDLLMNAKSCFERVLTDYPVSDWYYDSEERLKKVNRIIENINKARNLHNKA